MEIGMQPWSSSCSHTSQCSFSTKNAAQPLSRRSWRRVLPEPGSDLPSYAATELGNTETRV
eukprot:1212934-Rhodomonas_salina.1